MIPVRVRDEEMDVTRPVLQQRKPCLTEAGARIKDDAVLPGAKLEAGGVSAMLGVATTGYRDRASRAPEAGVRQGFRC